MYYPKQLPYLLDQEFNQHIEYKEYQFPWLEELAMCIWTMKRKHTTKKTIYNYILPDACIDLVINFTTKEISFAGFSKDTIPFELNKQIDYMGVRLKPGVFYALFQIPADQVMDHSISFSELEKNTDLENLFKTNDTMERINILKEYFQTKKINDSKYIHTIDILWNSPKEQTVLKIAKDLGYDKRHLYRIFKKQYGVSPKVLLNILRLHLSLTLLLENESIANIMDHCGFYDQSHFIKEIKRYTNFSPLELLKYDIK